MSTSLKEYIKKADRYEAFSKYTLGMTMAYFCTQNYYGAAAAILTSIILRAGAKIVRIDSYKSKEFLDLNELYKLILEKLAGNIRQLELGDIEGIFAYICYLYEHNYLSYDTNLSSYNTPIFNERAVLEALSLNNHGVCRNKAPMLTSLYKQFDIECHTVTGIFYQNVPFIISEMDVINDPEIVKLLDESAKNPRKPGELLEKIEDKVIEQVENKISKLESSPSGNHVITQVNSKDNTYLLDPYNKTFFNEAGENGRFYNDKGDFFKLVSARKKENYLEGISKMEFTDKKPIISPEEMEKRLQERKQRIEDNQDIVAEMREDIIPYLAEAEETYQLILRA